MRCGTSSGETSRIACSWSASGAMRERLWSRSSCDVGVSSIRFLSGCGLPQVLRSEKTAVNHGCSKSTNRGVHAAHSPVFLRIVGNYQDIVRGHFHILAGSFDDFSQVNRDLLPRAILPLADDPRAALLRKGSRTPSHRQSL